MRPPLRRLAPLLALLLAPLAACRHGGDGLTTAGEHGEARPAPAPVERPAPSPSHPLGGATARFRLLPPAPHRHSGAPASIHTFHLFAPRHP
jgi:hypothetical protein